MTTKKKTKKTKPTYAVGPSWFNVTNFRQYKPPDLPVLELFYSVKFAKTYLTHWMELPAYILGIVDENGNELKTKRDIKTKAEKEEYSPLNRICWLMKRMIQPIPGLQTQLMYKMWRLLMTKLIMHEDIMHIELSAMNSKIFLWEEAKATPTIKPGYYRINQDLLMGMGKQGDIIQVKKNIPSMGTILGKATYAIYLDGEDEDKMIILSDGEYDLLSDDEVDQTKEMFKQRDKLMEEDIASTSTANIEAVETAKQILFKKPYKRKQKRKSFIETVAKE